MVRQLLQSVFTTLELLELQILDDRLEHGKWEALQSTEANVRGETQSVRTTNAVSERNFTQQSGPEEAILKWSGLNCYRRAENFALLIIVYS